MTSRSGWTALLWGAAAAALEGLLHALPGLSIPDAFRPWVPVISAAIGFGMKHARTRAGRGD